MGPVHHGYTNQTRLLPGGIVEKQYQGPDAADRLQREHLCITQLPVCTRGGLVRHADASQTAR
jgi:hypothetical protein